MGYAVCFCVSFYQLLVVVFLSDLSVSMSFDKSRSSQESKQRIMAERSLLACTHYQNPLGAVYQSQGLPLHCLTSVNTCCQVMGVGASCNCCANYCIHFHLSANDDTNSWHILQCLIKIDEVFTHFSVCHSCFCSSHKKGWWQKWLMSLNEGYYSVRDKERKGGKRPVLTTVLKGVLPF